VSASWQIGIGIVFIIVGGLYPLIAAYAGGPAGRVNLHLASPATDAR